MKAHLSQSLAVSAVHYDLVSLCERWLKTLRESTSEAERTEAAEGLAVVEARLMGDDYAVPVTHEYGLFLDRVTAALARVKGGA